MPKMKPHKGLLKRIKVTGSGRLMRRKSCGSHLMSGKSAKRRRNLSKAVEVSPTIARQIRRLLP